jgi:UDP-N-acetylmuramyl pentapeptide phosphotransferase/UDP-N-acetylglucosamine-1-phosphate transferase
MILYFKIADKYNIIDKPNERSSHDYITIRGGGIIFWLAGLIYTLLPFTLHFSPFFIGLTLICGVSFWDDISSLPNKIRIVIHFLSISFVFYGLNLYAVLPWYLILAAYIFFVGVLNAYNFMDGINGITGLCSLSVLIPLWYVNEEVIPFTDPDFILFAILACIVFLFFNFRKKAKCFAGDIGSMGISFWILTLLVQLSVKSDSVVWMLFLTVYGVDSICTILHRLFCRQNIFKAHRFHFYQILSNERGISQLKVSGFYAFLQIIINVIVIYSYVSHRAILPVIGGFVTGVLILVYCIVKPKLITRY